MTARHAGVARIADQALIDQVRACANEMRLHLMSPLAATEEETAASRAWLNAWAGRAWGLLNIIGGRDL